MAGPELVEELRRNDKRWEWDWETGFAVLNLAGCTLWTTGRKCGIRFDLDCTLTSQRDDPRAALIEQLRYASAALEEVRRDLDAEITNLTWGTLAVK